MEAEKRLRSLVKKKGVQAITRMETPSHGRYRIQPSAMTVSDSEMDMAAFSAPIPIAIRSRTTGIQSTEMVGKEP